MATITIFREYSFILSLHKWKVYINGKLMGKVGNCSIKTFSLPEGNYEIYLNAPDFPITYRKRGLHSNSLRLKAEEGSELYLNVAPHPLIATKEHYPGMRHLFTPVECLLLLKQDGDFEENKNRLAQIGMKIEKEVKRFTFHRVTLLMMIAISLFAMVSNTIHPDIYATGDGLAWGILYGISSLCGLLSGRNKIMMARGWEHKFLLSAAVGALFILLFIPANFIWLRGVYLLFILAESFWAYFCFLRWKEKKKGLDKIEQMELTIENGF